MFIHAKPLNKEIPAEDSTQEYVWRLLQPFCRRRLRSLCFSNDSVRAVRLAVHTVVFGISPPREKKKKRSLIQSKENNNGIVCIRFSSSIWSEESVCFCPAKVDCTTSPFLRL